MTLAGPRGRLAERYPAAEDDFIDETRRGQKEFQD